MELRIRQLSDVNRLNLSVSARISQALRVNDIGTAQKLAESVAITSGQLRTKSPEAPSPNPGRPQSAHQIDVWA